MSTEEEKEKEKRKIREPVPTELDPDDPDALIPTKQLSKKSSLIACNKKIKQQKKDMINIKVTNQLLNQIFDNLERENNTYAKNVDEELTQMKEEIRTIAHNNTALPQSMKPIKKESNMKIKCATPYLQSILKISRERRISRPSTF